MVERPMYWDEECRCGHERIDHIDDNDRGWDGCQVDLITPDGPEPCGCGRFTAEGGQQ